MANPLRGEVDLRCGGKSHTLRLGIQSLILLEKRFGASVPRIMQERFSDPNNLMVSDMLTLLWVALQRADGGPSEDEVAGIMDEAGLQACGKAIGDLLAATFATGGTEGSENPR